MRHNRKQGSSDPTNIFERVKIQYRALRRDVKDNGSESDVLVSEDDDILVMTPSSPSTTTGGRKTSFTKHNVSA